ncbi:MAG: type II toxin-antitoxin system HicA family toxin [Dehalococcoidia bacterium]|nr:type II toxin-antitoxin system HicA family toxin [Dehalococcoidia bacterium]
MSDSREQSSTLSSRDRRLLQTILAGRSDANIRFEELRRLLLNMGFYETIRGSHHTFRRSGLRASVIIQPRNSMAKAYQIRQFRRIVIRHGLAPDDA